MVGQKMNSALMRLGNNVGKSAEDILSKRINTYSLESDSYLTDMVNKDDYIGEVVGINFSSAKVQISDQYKRAVSGIPSNCFLIASKIPSSDKHLVDSMNINERQDYFSKEENCIILLRVTGTANLSAAADIERVVMSNAANADDSSDWEQEIDDASIKNRLSFSGLQCKIIGTFFMEYESGRFVLKFGNDLSNFYSNSSIKVYKPSGSALSEIVNFGINKSSYVDLGKVRYTSTNRSRSGLSDVPVIIDPRDLIAQKTALFGMTRSGKSNTLKVVAKSLYMLRHKSGEKIGQIIFDANGEYANENVQDVNALGQAQALKNVWQIQCNGTCGSYSDVATYGLMENKKDPNRILMKINFYDDTLLQIGKELINDRLLMDDVTSAVYISSFVGVQFEPLDSFSGEYGGLNRELRKRLIYKTLLSEAGFKDASKGMAHAQPNNIFSSDLIAALMGKANVDEKVKDKKSNLELFADQYANVEENELSDDADDIENEVEFNKYYEAGEILNNYNKNGETYVRLARAFTALIEFIKDPKSNYRRFESLYTRKSSSGNNWLDVNTSSLLEMFYQKNAAKRIKKAVIYHDVKTKNRDYTDMIYDDLVAGKLVIVDQALGDSSLNKMAAERILRNIFNKNNEVFASANTPPPIIIMVEEAHNMLPKGSDDDTTNIWARTAKEGAKFNIGIVYSTQEVSSIQKNILKSTANFFISHLNNTEEVKALSAYYDFADFSNSIIQAEDKGFIRLKMKSNRFVVPVQVDKFEILT